MPKPNRPHIVLICTDQHRAASVGAYGSRVCRTPTLDRLASQGTLFTRCYAQNPVSSPSRSTIMTGLLSRNHGVLNNGTPLSRSLPTLADTLKSHGYHTAAFGKMHLTPQSEGVPEAPYYGFDHLDCTEDNRIGPSSIGSCKTSPSTRDT